METQFNDFTINSLSIDYERQNTFGFRRESTFTGTTENEWYCIFLIQVTVCAGFQYSRTLSNLGQEIGRRISTVGQTIDPDAQFTKAIIQDYVKYNRTGGEGDGRLPFLLTTLFLSIYMMDSKSGLLQYHCRRDLQGKPHSGRWCSCVDQWPL